MYSQGPHLRLRYTIVDVQHLGVLFIFVLVLHLNENMGCRSSKDEYVHSLSPGLFSVARSSRLKFKWLIQAWLIQSKYVDLYVQCAV